MSAVVSSVRSAALRPPDSSRHGRRATRQPPSLGARRIERGAFQEETAFVADGAGTGNPELLLLARCAEQIAAEAGTGSILHAAGARRQAELLSAALAAVDGSSTARPGPGPQRHLVYLPGDLVAAQGTDGLGALLHRTAVDHGDDALAVIAVDASISGPATANAGPRSTVRCWLAHVAWLARAAGWDVCQLWSDGMARHALVVVERAMRGSCAAAS